MSKCKEVKGTEVSCVFVDQDSLCPKTSTAQEIKDFLSDGRQVTYIQGREGELGRIAKHNIQIVFNKP